MVASMTQRAGASQKRIDEFLNTQPEITSKPGAEKHTVTGAVSFSNVSFTYPHTGITAIKNLNLDVKPGQKIAVMGKTGSGKSTIAHLLLRMYDPTNGAVLLDDKKLVDIDLQDMRRQIGYTPQDVFLFSDTIYNNIKFGKADADETTIKKVAKIASLDKEIAQQPKEYETLIGERGVMLSGGQKQRLVLARALLKNSKILLLDDCLSAVDTQTEKNILSQLKDYVEDKTVFVMTHRVFTTWDFDKIIVLDHGAIAEQGTHDELMALDGTYAQLYRHQTSLE